MPAKKPNPLTDVEKELFNQLIDVVRGVYSNARPALLKEDNGKACICVVSINPDDPDGDRSITPLAILVDGKTLKELSLDGKQIVDVIDPDDFDASLVIEDD